MEQDIRKSAGGSITKISRVLLAEEGKRGNNFQTSPRILHYIQRKLNDTDAGRLRVIFSIVSRLVQSCFHPRFALIHWEDGLWHLPQCEYADHEDWGDGSRRKIHPILMDLGWFCINFPMNSAHVHPGLPMLLSNLPYGRRIHLEAPVSVYDENHDNASPITTRNTRTTVPIKATR